MSYVKNILVAAEETEFTNSVKRHLKREGYFVFSANNCVDALKKIHTAYKTNNKKFDLLITDSSIKNGFGIKLIKIIIKNYPNISIIAISGFGDFNLVKNIIRKERDDYYQKPITPEHMIKMILNIEQKRWKLDVVNNYAMNNARSNVLNT